MVVNNDHVGVYLQASAWSLTHWGWDKMVPTLATYTFKCISLNENSWIFDNISLRYVTWDIIDNMAALVQIMAWRQTGDKPLSEALLLYCADVYMRHLALVS